MNYKNAPVSELIFGINYSALKISTDQLFALNTIFSEEFPILEILPPLFLDELNGFQLIQTTDPATSGPFLIRRRSTDNKWLIQLQSNRIYLNWIRNDAESVGNYIGYTAAFNKFLSIISIIEKQAGVNLKTGVSSLDLTYHDRFSWQDHITDLSKLQDIMSISSPPLFSEEGYNNIFSKFTFPDAEIKGYGLININTGTSIVGNQIIKVEVNLRGNPVTDTLDTWFSIAHKKHLYIFDNLFKETLKRTWN